MQTLDEGFLEEVALDRAQRAPCEPDRVGCGTQIARDEGQVGGLDRHVGAGADGETEVCSGERRGVVDAVADHGDDLARLLQAPHLVDLVLGQHVREHLRDPDCPCDREARTVREPLDRRQRSDLVACALGDRAAMGCSLASSTAPASRRSMARSTPSAGIASASHMDPRSPSRLVEHDGGDLPRVLEHLGAKPYSLPSYPAIFERDYAPMSAATRERLRTYFAPHNERLYALLGEDLGWERP